MPNLTDEQKLAEMMHSRVHQGSCDWYMFPYDKWESLCGEIYLKKAKALLKHCGSFQLAQTVIQIILGA